VTCASIDRPAGRSAVARVRAALVACHLGSEILEFPESTRTAQDAARAIGTSVAQIVKSLVFTAGGEPLDEARIEERIFFHRYNRFNDCIESGASFPQNLATACSGRNQCQLARGRYYAVQSAGAAVDDENRRWSFTHPKLIRRPNSYIRGGSRSLPRVPLKISNRWSMFQDPSL